MIKCLNCNYEICNGCEDVGNKCPLCGFIIKKQESRNEKKQRKKNLNCLYCQTPLTKKQIRKNQKYCSQKCASASKRPRAIIVPLKKFGKLTIIKKVADVHHTQRGSIYDAIWLCKCDCGKYIETRGVNLQRTFRPKLTCGCEDSYKTRPHQERIIIGYYKIYQTNARQDQKVFRLSFNQFVNIVNQNCIYCNIPPSTKRSNRQKNVQSILVNGIDRINNDLGYILDNCAPCCKKCNTMKTNMPIFEFITHIQKIYENSKNNKLLLKILKKFKDCDKDKE